MSDTFTLNENTRFRRARQILAVVIGAALIAGSTLFGGVQSAAAASYGPGYSYQGNYDAGFLGGFIQPGGLVAYCIEPGVPGPVNAASINAGIVTSYTSSGPVLGQNQRLLDATILGRINLIVTKYGQTTNNIRGAAVALAIAHIANPAAQAARTSPWGDNFYMNYTSASNWNQIKSLSDQYRTEAAAFTPGATTGSANLTFQVDPLDHYEGTLTIDALSHSPATATLVLTNGIFHTTGTNTIVGSVSQGQTFDIRGVPPVDGEPYKIYAEGNFQASSSYGGKIRLWQNPGRQSTATPGGPDLVEFTANAEDPFDRDTVFLPVVTTQVGAKFVQIGETFSDVVTFSTVAQDPVPPETEGINNSWAQTESGDYFTLIANGTLYGPFDEQPVESATIPVGAPVAGTATINTGVTGPSISYTATTTETATNAGFYTWVWTIDYADQPLVTQMFLIDDYVFVDRFGQVAETSISPSIVVATTNVSASTVALSEEMTDTLTVSLVSPSIWLRDNGEQIPVTFTGTAYHVPGVTAPDVSTTVPSGSIVVGTTTITVNEPGLYTSPSVAAPSTGDGWVTWVWEIRTADQPVEYQGWIREWADQFGLAAESSQILTPAVTTQAQPLIALGEPAWDTAIVSGTLPAINPSLIFEAYLQDDPDNPVCEVSNLSFSTASNPIEVDDVGEYRSEEVIFTDYGTYFWVETLLSHDDQIIHRGDCGAENETTEVRELILWTQATGSVTVGQEARDNAFIRGVTPVGSYLTFSVFLQPTGDNVAPTCEASNEVFTSDRVTVDGPGDYPSPSTPLEEVGTYFWVETLWSSSGAPLHVGLCGEPLETTLVLMGSLPFTGLDDENVTSTIMLGGGILLLGAGMISIHMARGREGNTVLAAQKAARQLWDL